MELLEGKKIAKDILRGLEKEARGRNLKLVIVLVGEDPASLIFVKEKERACKKIGIGFELFKFSSDIKQDELEKKIREIARKEDTSGLVVQLPLPKSLNAQNILDIIPAGKDVDVLSQGFFEEFKAGNSLILPPVVAAIDCLLREYEIDIKDKKIVLVGLGRVVGLPLSVWLSQKGIKFEVVEKLTENPELVLQKAQVIISGVGKPELIKGEAIREGAIVIDAATVLSKGQLVGDIDLESVSKKAEFLAPVPGGVGPLTVAYLLDNLVKINKRT